MKARKRPKKHNSLTCAEKTSREVFKTKKYKTVGGFVRGCRSAMKDVLGHDEDLTMVVDSGDEHLRGKHYEHLGKTFLEVLRETGKLSYGEGGKDSRGRPLGYKRGFDFRLDDGMIYVYSEECE